MTTDHSGDVYLLTEESMTEEITPTPIAPPAKVSK